MCVIRKKRKGKLARGRATKAMEAKRAMWCDPVGKWLCKKHYKIQMETSRYNLLRARIPKKPPTIETIVVRTMWRDNSVEEQSATGPTRPQLRDRDYRVANFVESTSIRDL